MKKSVLFTAFLAVSALTQAQLVVDSLGNTALGYDGDNVILSDFAVNGRGLSSTCTYIDANGKTYGLYVKECESVNTPPADAPDRSMPPHYGIYSQTDPSTSGYYYSIFGKSYATSGQSGYTYGVYGIAGNGASGHNYGTFGTLYGTANGAGVYGSSTSGDTGVSIGGRYAGYFNGNVRVAGSLTANSVTQTSDYRLKHDIKPVGEDALAGIMALNAVEFKYNQRKMDCGDGNAINLYEEDSPILKNKHYGLIAQELQEIFPDLVIEEGDGYLSVNYIELIPLLIHSVQELSARLEIAEKANAQRVEGTTETASELLAQTTLCQNAPNPFTESTTIALSVAEDVTSAMLYIYDLNGKQIAEYPVIERGDTSIVIEGRSLEAGMYLYSLIADGNVIDTKRMILTK